MILFELDENSGKPKSRQISDLLADRMKSGILKPGDRLPSTRKLADMLRVHRSTVAPAYQTLWSLGFVELRRGRLLRWGVRTFFWTVTPPDSDYFEIRADSWHPMTS